VPPLEHFLLVAAAIFSIGLYGALSRKNIITVFMSVELMFNAVNLTALALARFLVPVWSNRFLFGSELSESVKAASNIALSGQVLAIFIIAVAAAEIALGLAIVIAIYRNRETIDITDLALMKK
jgi:NADH:ubiquinone oxidoreductase subunit K